MNRTVKSALIVPSHLQISLFHSTPVLDRRRRTHWVQGGRANKGSYQKKQNYYARRSRKMHGREELLHNVGAFAEHLFKSWQYDHDEYHPFSNQDSSWFRHDFRPRGSNERRTNNKGSHPSGRRNIQFCEEEEVETIFRSAFSGNKYFFWSFVNEEPQKTSSGYYNKHHTSWKWRNQNDSSEDEYDSSTESESVDPDLISERLALGLSRSGPLSLDVVKNAYRACALKWHPDRHEGSSKVIAEEKFKVCSAAYQSLCEKLALD